jgi:predicted RNase H-like HicB family nuclease
MMLYDLQITVEEIADGGDYRYMATSSDLPNLIVAGETVEEVLVLAPHVAEALIASMQAAGDPLPATLRPIQTLPFASHVAVPV